MPDSRGWNGGATRGHKLKAPTAALAKRLCLSHYGWNCACCGESNPEFLQMDHMDNGGYAHRKDIRGRSVYQWLVMQDFPSGFQILCSNCNWARGMYGYCPHVLERHGKWLRLRQGWRKEGWEPIPLFLGRKKFRETLAYMERVEKEALCEEE